MNNKMGISKMVITCKSSIAIPIKFITEWNLNFETIIVPIL